MAWIRTKENKLYKDAEGNKVDTKEWWKVDESLWNTTTFLAYVEHLNKQKFGKAPINASLQTLRAIMKKDMERFGNTALRIFLEMAVADYRSNMRYPTLSYSQARLLYMERFMSVALEKAEQKATDESTPQTEYTLEEVVDLF
ncbi:hypothetical protein [Enterococcus phage PEF7b]